MIIIVSRIIILFNKMNEGALPGSNHPTYGAGLSSHFSKTAQKAIHGTNVPNIPSDSDTVTKVQLLRKLRQKRGQMFGQRPEQPF